MDNKNKLKDPKKTRENIHTQEEYEKLIYEKGKAEGIGIAYREAFKDLLNKQYDYSWNEEEENE